MFPFRTSRFLLSVVVILEENYHYDHVELVPN